jgi:hypothetical protein
MNEGLEPRYLLGSFKGTEKIGMRMKGVWKR